MNAKSLENPKIASLLFETPLMIDPRKLEVLIRVLGPKYNLSEGAVGDVEIDLTDLEQGKVNAVSNAPMSRRGNLLMDGDIAVIPISGTLVNRSMPLQAWSGLSSYEQIKSQLQAAINDNEVKAIALDVDSPGGMVEGVFDLADFIYAARGKKPIWSMVNENAMSAAYLLASAADKVISPRTGMTGSIGVIATHLDRSELDSKIGLKFTTIFAGARKNDGNPHEPLSKEAKELFQGNIDSLYTMFVAAVARNRNLSEQAVRDTEAGFFMAEDALEIGLIDVTAPADQGFEQLAASIGNDNPAQLKTQSKGEISMSDPNPKPDVSTNTPASSASAPETPPQSNVVDLDSARTEGSVEARDRSLEIMQTCELAGFPAKAQDFIKGNLSMADIRQSLVTMKANADEIEVQSHSDGNLATSQPNQGSGGLGNQAPVDLEKSPLVVACTKLAGQSAAGY